MGYIKRFGRDVSPAELAIRGRIKIGRLGEVRKAKDGSRYRLPRKLDHFLVTTNERETVPEGEPPGNFLVDTDLQERLEHQYGSPLRKIPVVLPLDDIDAVYSSRFAAYRGREKPLCSGDGEVAIWRGADKVPLFHGGDTLPDEVQIASGQAIKCPGMDCPVYRGLYAGRRLVAKCRCNVRLVVAILGDETLGAAHLFSSTSFHSTRRLQTSLLFLAEKAAEKGQGLSETRMLLCLEQRTVTNPETGEEERAWVTHLEFDGDIARVLESAAERQRALLSSGVEPPKTKLLADKIPEDSDHVDEFYPEVVAGEDTSQAPQDAPETSVPDPGPKVQSDPVPAQDGMIATAAAEEIRERMAMLPGDLKNDLLATYREYGWETANVIPEDKGETAFRLLEQAEKKAKE